MIINKEWYICNQVETKFDKIKVIEITLLSE